MKASLFRAGMNKKYIISLVLIIMMMSLLDVVAPKPLRDAGKATT